MDLVTVAVGGPGSAGPAGGDALVESAAGRASGDHRSPFGGHDLEEVGLQPWRVETFKFSTDPELEAKVRDVVGLYLRPAGEGGGALRGREVPGAGAGPDRADPAAAPGLPEKQTHDYVRHGTTTLFAALEVATGKVTDACYPRHRHEEFLRFLKQVAKAYPRVKLHIVCDNYATHKHPKVKAWLAKNPRITCTSPRPRDRG